MTATNHALTGAVIALAVKQPALAIVLAFLSHYILDSLPHFGLPKSVELQERNKSRLFRSVIKVDGVLFVVLESALCYLAAKNSIGWVVFFGSLAAFVPDVAWLYRAWWERKHHTWRAGTVFSRFHTAIQWRERPWGLAVEIVWFGMALFLGRSLL